MWIQYSLMMFFASVALYLCVRKASLLKVPVVLTNLAMFAIPLVAYSVIGLSSEQTFHMTVWQFLLVIVAAAVFAYGGNTTSLKAISIAPNPGYSLVLSKSYVLFTTIVAITLLDAELTTRKAIAILVIVGFSALIMVNKKAAKHVQSNRWVWLSFAAFFGWGMLSLSSKYLFNHGVSTIPFLMLLYLVVTICILAANKTPLKSLYDTGKKHRVILLAIGVFTTLFNLGQFEAIQVAPNLGYVNAINASSLSLVTVLAVVFFKDELTLKKAVGVMGVTAGLLLLLLG